MTTNPGPWLDMPWELTETLLDGHSAIDVARLYLTGIADAEDFLRCYGFDLNRADEAREVESIRREAIEFITQDLLCDEPDLEIPAVVREESDVRRILLWASTPHEQPRQRWACSLLRVMHTFAHCGSYFQDLYGEEIREQILQSFRPHLHLGPTGLTLGSGEEAIPLRSFQMRGKKSRRSIALKLLHKVENVSADVFDWVGIRFVTEHRYDALLTARYLRAHNVIMFANVRPGRSRNTLIDLEEVKRLTEQSVLECSSARERLDWMRQRVVAMPAVDEPARSTYNPFSASVYNSIQFTCSQQVRVANPHMASLKRVVRNQNRYQTLSRTLDRFGVQTGISFFFPFEVQILDAVSFESSRSGRASHAEYKARQRHAVKRRLWGDWIGEEPRPMPGGLADRTDSDSDLFVVQSPAEKAGS